VIFLKLKAAALEEVTWPDVKAQVQALDPQLFEAIEEFGPNSRHTLFKVSYPYGAEILKNGVFQVPIASGEVVPITDDRVPDVIRKKLGYNNLSNPVAWILKGSAEFFLNHMGNTFPFSGMIKKGRLFGTLLVLSEKGIDLHPNFLWSLTAGARSMFSLAKVSEVVGLNRLEKHFQVNLPKESEYQDQWNLFRALANAPGFDDPWRCEVLFFSDAWFDWSDKKSAMFKLSLHEKAWRATEFWRNQFLWDVVYSVFKQEKVVKVNPAIADIVRQISLIAAGVQPGFAPLHNDDAGPISAFQKALIDVYKIEYQPIFMGSQLFAYEDPNDAVYYSLEYPISLSFSPSSKKVSTKIADLLEIKYLLTKYLNFLKTSKLNIEGTRFYDVPTRVSFHFFHHMANEGERIFSPENIFKEDANFEDAVNVLGEDLSLSYPVNSNFLNGCMRLSQKHQGA
jgi:hypothetical protein